MEIQNNDNSTNLIAGLYARVSSEKQEQEQTINSQIDEIASEIERDGNTLSSENTFIDDGWSGTMLERPSLDKMRDAAKEGRFQILYVYDRGRLSRVFVHQELILSELNDLKIKFKTLHDISGESPEEKLMQSVIGVFHEYDRIKILEKFRRGKLYKSRHGGMINGSAIYGYFYIKKTETIPTHYEINEDEANVVRMIFDWVGNRGYSVKEVIRQLYRLGIKPKKQKSDFWTKGPITRMLRCDTYVIGQAYYLKTEAVIPKNPFKHEKYKKVKKSSRRTRPREDWIPLPVPVILEDKDLFDRVQKIISDNQKYAPKNRKYNYLLTGKVLCECGQRRVGDGYSKGQHHYYRCAERLYKLPNTERKCRSHGVNAVMLDGFLWMELQKFLSDPSQLKEQANNWLKDQSVSTSHLDSEISKISKNIEKAKEEKMRYTRVYGSGDLDFDQFETLSKELEKKVYSYNQQIKELSDSAVKINYGENDVDTLCCEATIVLENMDKDDQKRIIHDIIDHVVIYDKGEIEVKGHIPFTQKMGYETIYRNRRSSQRRQINSF